MEKTLNKLDRSTMKMRMENAPPGEPAGHRLLIKPDEIPEKIGGIWIPATVRSQHTVAMESGTVVTVGMNAFMGYGNSDPWCQAGDHIRYVRYAGKYVEIPQSPPGSPDKPENVYQVINDEDVFFVDGGE